DVEEQWERMEDVVDSLLEKADICMDQAKGRDNQGSSASVVTQSTPQVTHSKVGYKVMHSSNIPRPQLTFPDRVDNSLAPFQRKIQDKPNALVPLSNGTPSAANSGDEEWDSHHQSLGIADHLVSLPHPYAYEIAQLEHPASLFTPHTPQPFLPFDKTPAQWIDTLEALKVVTRKLEGQSEIAVDLEAHDMRSYQGFTCLIQISTRKEDFLLDALVLRPHLHLLNQAFTDPSIVKVFHGATMDIEWLQRDFGVYVVNLFDTYHATKVLSFPSHSLASLLLKYANVNADKKYQLADWRIRPIPQEMLQYAQADTHYLLYIFDLLRNELLAGPSMQEEGEKKEEEEEGAEIDPTQWMRDVLKRSNNTSLRKYEKPIYDAIRGRDKGGWGKLLERWERPLDGAQMAVFKAVHAWRDQVARDEDESVRYVLPNHQLFSLAERCPVDQAGVIACCIPTPPVVRMHASDLALLIQHAESEAL
ncbi:ribonuclease H-like domain-containing protein, partial [Piptocephalis cylindrospora]